VASSSTHFSSYCLCRTTEDGHPAVRGERAPAPTGPEPELAYTWYIGIRSSADERARISASVHRSSTFAMALRASTMMRRTGQGGERSPRQADRRVLANAQRLCPVQSGRARSNLGLSRVWARLRSIGRTRHRPPSRRVFVFILISPNYVKPSQARKDRSG
jgi:hypothetical protein